MDLLNFRIKDIKNVTVDPQEDEAELMKKRYDYVCRCVQYHLECIEFVEGVQYVYKTVLAIELTVFTLMLTSTVLGSTLLPFGMELIINIGFGTCYSLIVVATYWMANEIILKSADVAISVYKTPWYEYDIKTRKALMLIQMRAKKPLILKAAMIHINLDTMIRVYRATYSAYTVLRQMNN
ncbi:odorant receptor 30a-like [Ctenocephalides felis]|uniref:odorant receptor 30a-like n=1 Tax=Ctenocephalides felis TaxID=7515 RepID=UPI000E6E10C2|nr:odorant receptor 30a-like [Ctenocephalides felis]